MENESEQAMEEGEEAGKISHESFQFRLLSSDTRRQRMITNVKEFWKSFVRLKGKRSLFFMSAWAHGNTADTFQIAHIIQILVIKKNIHTYMSILGLID